MLEHRATLGDKQQAPVEHLCLQPGKRMGTAYLRQHILGDEAGASSQRDQMLHQHIEAHSWRPPCLDLTGLPGPARRGNLDQLQGMAGHAEYFADCPRLVPGAAGPLHQPGDAFRAAYLHDPVHRGEIHAQIKAGGANHTAESTLAQTVLDATAHLAINRAVVQPHLRNPLQPGLEDGFKPEFGLGAGVGEQQ